MEQLLDKKILGENIRNLRREKKITQEKLAEIIGCSTAHYGQIERGEVDNPSFVYIANIANYHGVSLDKIAYGNLLNPENYFIQELLSYTSNFCAKKKILILEMLRSNVQIMHQFDEIQ